MNMNINICSMQLKWDMAKQQKYDMITRWGEYEFRFEMEVIYMPTKLNKLMTTYS